jgi:3-oxoacyl-[acyl-carrier-protein] synthase II
MQDSWALTGTGLISAVGDSPGQLFAALRKGQVPTAAVEIEGFNPKDYINRKGLKFLSRTSQLACVAAELLGKEMEGLDPADIGVLFGTAWAALDTIVNFEHEAHIEGPRFVDPLLFTETVANVPAGQISIFNGWSAFNMTVVEESASGIGAICQAIEFLEQQRGDYAVAGGGDGINRQLLSTLDAGSTRLTAGEGACLFCIESAAHATARGAIPQAIVRAGLSRFAGSDASSASKARQDWLAELLANADLEPESIDLVVISGNGNTERDEIEAELLRAGFGSATPTLLAPKAVLGETWAASGPLGVAAAIEAIYNAIIPAHPQTAPLGECYDGLNLPCEEHHGEVQNVVVLDCSETGRFAGLVISSEGAR